MDRRTSEHNDINRFGPHAIKAQLSPFGCKVFDNLIKLWKREQSSISRMEYHSALSVPSCSRKTLKVLTFEDSSNTQTAIPSPFPPALQPRANISNDIVNEELAFNFKVPSENNDTTIPRSLELVKPIPDIVNNDTSNFRFEETFQLNLKHNVMNSIYNEEDATDFIQDPMKLLNANKPYNNVDVPWNDMFGEELLSDVASIDHLLCRNNIETHVDVDRAVVQEVDEKHNDKIKTKVTKRKPTSSNIDTLQKKIKASSKESNSNKNINKKTTKAVKQWLCNVNPVNEANDEQAVTYNKVLVDQTSTATENIICKETTKSPPKIKILSNYKIEISKDAKEKKKKDNKKTIQAKLANKDGVMKFDKPEKPHGSSDTESKSQGNKAEIEVKGREKESKKQRFIAPIKSQIAVKDITFDITHLDENNMQEFIDFSITDNDAQILMFLIQNNGFSQLNNQHTEDECQYDGIMFHVPNKFYYLKNNYHPNMRSELLKVLNKSKVVCYDGKSLLMHCMVTYKFESADMTLNLLDAKIAGALIDPDKPPENFSELQKLVCSTPDYTVATECPLQKAAWYAGLLLDCVEKLKGFLVEYSLWNVFVNIEMKLVPIITDMERQGICVDMEKLKSMEALLQTKMKAVEQACHKAAGKVFQINSPAQVRAIIYDELKLDQRSNVTVRETLMKGAKSTSEAMLRSLTSVHELPKLILEYRHLHKAHATFLTGITQHVQNGVVKPTWDQTAAVTGRIASNNPNLQAIPKAPFSLNMFTAEGDEKQQVSFRSVYTCQAGHSFLAADFQHVECRVFAHAAADIHLLSALGARGDVFRLLAAKWLKKAECEVSAEDRERTKRIVYASLYGAGARKLMDILQVSYESTLAITASFNRTFPSLKEFGRSVVSRCGQQGGRLSTLCGRMRTFPHIHSKDFQLKSQAERQAVNFIVQGSAADLCKLAMVLTTRRLRGAGLRARLLLQLHDELVWEIQDQHMLAAAALIKEVMEHCGMECGMSITLPVSLSQGRNWGDMKPLHI